MSEDDSKKLELLTPEEKKEYQKAEAKWEKQVLNEAERLVKRMRFGVSFACYIVLRFCTRCVFDQSVFKLFHIYLINVP